MTLSLPTYILAVDLGGSVAMIVISFLCLQTARRISARTPGNFMYGYLVWIFAALFAFSLSRAIGHILRHALELSGHGEYWQVLSPISGSINSATFLVIASITLFFRTMRKIMSRIAKDRARIRRISRELLSLNQNTEAIVTERTRTELALKVAHEIRNPVMVIGGIAGRLLKNDMPEEERHKKLEMIRKQADRLNSIVKQFENFQDDTSWAFSLNTAEKLVEEAIDIIMQEAEEKGIEIIFHPAETPVFIEANGYLIKMGLMHCLRNAIEASSSGQQIEVSTERTDVGVIIRIKDSGHGIPESTMKEIFDPAYGMKSKHRGLGLAVVKQIVEEHGGSINISSDMQTGTEVEIFLPAQLGASKNWKKQ